MGVIVDTSILVRAERERNSEWRSVLPSDEDVAVSTITISEITVGLHFAASPAIVYEGCAAPCIGRPVGSPDT